MITLPPVTSTTLKSFSIAVSSLSGLMVCILALLFQSKLTAGVGVSLTVGFCAVGLLWPHMVSKPYRAWNRLAHIVTRILRQSILAISYYSVFAVVSQTRPSAMLTTSNSSESLWRPRTPRSTIAYFRQYNSTRNPLLAETGWISTFFSWSIQSSNIWTWCLLPFLLILSLLEESEHQGHVPSETYTLY